MRLRRMITGCSLLMGSSWISYYLSEILHTSQVGSVAVTTLVGFFAGMVFLSGHRTKVVKVYQSPKQQGGS